MSPPRRPEVSAAVAGVFADLAVSPGGQVLIARFGVDEVGAPLFVPGAAKRLDASGRR